MTAAVVGPGKKWHNLELNKNGTAIRQNVHVKKGDTVVVIAGSDKGKVSEVVKVLPKTSKVVVKDVNIITKHNKPKVQGEPGEITRAEGPIASSNVMHYSKEKQVRSRVGIKVENGKKIRYLKKTGETLAN